MKANLHRTLRRIRKLQYQRNTLPLDGNLEKATRELDIRMMALSEDLILLRWCNEEKLAMQDCLRVLIAQPQYRLDDKSLVALARRHRKRLRLATKALKIERARRRMADVEKEFDRWDGLKK